MAVRYIGDSFISLNRFLTWLPTQISIDVISHNYNGWCTNEWLAMDDLISIRKEDKDPRQNGDWMLELVKMVKDGIAEISKSGAV
jgi:hypothetical protein